MLISCRFRHLEQQKLELRVPVGMPPLVVPGST
jgi:hypothetical protein